VNVNSQDSVFLVTGNDPDNQQFGSAFAIYSDKDANEYNGANVWSKTAYEQRQARHGEARLRGAAKPWEYPGIRSLRLY
jgi:hypothetical protein